MRMVTAAVMVAMPANKSAAGHRREKRDLAGAGDQGVRLDVGVVDRSPDHPRRLEGMGIGLAALGQPTDQILNGADAGRGLEGFLGLSDPLAHPGEILDLHASSSLMR